MRLPWEEISVSLDPVGFLQTWVAVQILQDFIHSIHFNRPHPGLFLLPVSTRLRKIICHNLLRRRLVPVTQPALSNPSCVVQNFKGSLPIEISHAKVLFRSLVLKSKDGDDLTLV